MSHLPKDWPQRLNIAGSADWTEEEKKIQERKWFGDLAEPVVGPKPKPVFPQHDNMKVPKGH